MMCGFCNFASSVIDVPALCNVSESMRVAVVYVQITTI